MISPNLYEILSALMFICTMFYLYETGKENNEKTKLLRDNFSTPHGFFFCFLFSPVLLAVVYYGNWKQQKEGTHAKG